MRVAGYSRAVVTPYFAAYLYASPVGGLVARQSIDVLQASPNSSPTCVHLFAITWARFARKSAIVVAHAARPSATVFRDVAVLSGEFVSKYGTSSHRFAVPYVSKLASVVTLSAAV